MFSQNEGQWASHPSISAEAFDATPSLQEDSINLRCSDVNLSDVMPCDETDNKASHLADAGSTQKVSDKQPKPEIDRKSELPSEIMQRIISHLLGGKVRININVRRSHGYGPSRHMHLGFPAEVTSTRPLLWTSRVFRDNTIAVLGSDLEYYANSIQFEDLPSAFGRGNCLRI